MVRRRWPASFILTAGVVLATGAIPAASIEPDHEIRLLSQRFTPPAGVPEIARQAIDRRAEELRAQGKERLHLLVQLHEIPSPAGRKELARQGLNLGAFVPGSAFIAAVPVGRAVASIARPEVRWATLWEAGYKLHPRVAAGDWAPWTRDPARPKMVAVMLLLHHDVPLEAGPVLAEKVGGVALPAVEGLHGMTVWLPQTRVAELAAEEEVLWIEEAPPPLTPTNDGVRSGMRATELADPPYSLTGSGVRLFVFDEGTVRQTHETFTPGTGSRVTLIDGTLTSSHATHVAGTAAGDGSGSAGDRGRGVAPGVSVLSAGYEQVAGTMLFWDNAGDIEADYALARKTHLADLGTNSIGSNTAQNGYPCEREGDYGVASSLIDSIVLGTNAAVGSPVFMTWAAGNERNTGSSVPGRCGSNYGTTAPPSCAKNPLHVGAVNSDGLAMTEFSSWGPCDDGRLKPTLVAPGCETGLVTGETGVFSSTAASDSSYGGDCGTSMATPGVAGVASLLTQAWREMGLGGPTERPLPALIKAILIHAARDLGPEGPDYVYGYGAVDAKAAIDLLRGNDSITRGWIIGTVGQGEIREHYINGPWQDLDEAKVTLVWDDPAAAPFAAEALVNDLTLEYSNGSNDFIPYQPWVLAPASPHLPATTGVDSRNNVEQIVVHDVPMSDTLMRVIGTRVPRGPQSYALVFSFNPVVVDKIACRVTSSTFETGTDGWTLSGAARTLAPESGHGAAVRLGGDVDTFHEVTRAVVVPTEARAELAFWWYMTTEESLDLFGFGFDPFTAEIRNSSGAVLAVVDLRNDGWPQGRWIQQRIDLTPWAGQTVTIAFTATNDFEAATTFWIDDVTVTSCPKICNIGGSTTNISVTPVDDPPVAVADSATVVEDSGANAINVLANDTDVDGGPISIISVTQPANGTVAITGCGTGLIYAPNPNYCNSPPGTTLDTFTYTLTPGGSTATVTITVTCVDDDPVAVNDSATVTEDSGANAVNVLANDTDVDGGGPIWIQWVTQPANGTVAITGGGTGLTYTPNANYCNIPPGTTLDTFTYTLTPGGSTTTVTVAVICVDDDPMAVADSATVLEDSGANAVNVLANDTDVDGGPISITSVTQPANGTVVITGGGTGLTYAPNANYCNNPPGTPDTFTYTLSPGVSTAAVSVTVTCLNDAPVLDLDADDSQGTTGSDFAVIFTEGEAAKLIEDPVDATVTDVDNTTLATLTVAITNLFDTGNEILSTDVTGTSITASYVTVPGAPGTGTLTLTGPDTLANFGTVLRKVKYLNTSNAPNTTPRVINFVANDGATTSNTAVSTVTVQSVDTDPTAVNDSATVNEDPGANAINVLANDTDPDGGPISITSVTQPANGTVVITGGGTGLTYAPNANYCNSVSGVPDTFTYTLTPGGSTATVSVTVTCVDDNPVAMADSATVVEDSTNNAISVLANDTDVDGGAISIASVTQPANGTVAITGGGTGVTYTPNANYCNNPPGSTLDTFTYTLTPGGSTATVSVTVTCVDDPPVAVADAATVVEDSGANALPVLANDTDIDGGAKLVQSVTQPANGTVVITGGGTGLTHAPNANYCNNPPGTTLDTFNYTLTPGGSPSTVTVTVTCVKDPPVADNDTFDFIGNTDLVVDQAALTTPHVLTTTPTTLGVLDGDSDPVEGDAIAVSAITVGACTDSSAPFDCSDPAVGRVQMQTNGRFIFTPAPGDTGATETFQYTVTANGVPAPASTIATVTLTRFERVWYVKNDAPAGGNGTSASPFNSITAANLSDNDSDGDLTDDLDSAGDYIFVYFGTGTAANQSGGLVLENGQHLIGQHAGLSLNVSLNGNGAPTNLVAAAAGSRPLLDDTVVDVFEGVSARNVIPAEIVGMNLAGNVNGIDWTTTTAFAGTGTFEIRDNVVRSATNEGVDINLAGTGATRLSFHDNNLTATGTGLDIQETGTGALTITAFDDNVVSGNTGGSGIFVSNAVFDSVPGGALNTVNGGTTLIGDPGNPAGSSLTNGALWLDQVTGSLSFTDLDISAAGFGLSVGGTGPFTGASGMNIQVTPAPPDNTGSATIVANNGAAVAISNATVDLRLAGITSTPTTFSTSGVDFLNVAGQFRAPAGSSINKVSGIGAAFQIDNSTAGTTVLTSVYSGTINNSSASARAVRINNADSGSSASFTGSLTETGQGVSLTNNTGATVSFSGGLSLSTGANPAFTATGGGTISVCDENPCNGGATGALVNTLTTTTGTALDVANTTISSNNLEFRSISAGTGASGPANGILLNNTGSLGGLKVKGSGSAASGGTIQRCGTGISLTNTLNVSLSRMQLNDFTDFAIRGSSVVNFDMDNSVINGINGNDAVADEGSVRFTELTGSASISTTSISGSVETNLRVVNTTGSLNRLTLSGTTIGTNSTTTGDDGLFFEAQATAAVMNVTVQNSFFTASRGDLAQFNNASSGTMDVVVSGTAFSDNHPAIVSGGVVLGAASGTMTYNVNTNTFRDATGTALAVFCSSAGVSCIGRLENNQIGLAGTPNSGSTNASGISIVSSGGGTVTTLVNNNTIRQYNNHGILLQAGQTGGNPTTFNATLTNNTIGNPGTINTDFNGIHLNNGTLSGENFTSCVDIRTNSIAGSGTGVAVPNNADFRLRQRQSTTVRLPGYGGANNNDAAVVAFVSGNQTTVTTGAASNTVPTGGGFLGGASCPTPP